MSRRGGARDVRVSKFLAKVLRHQPGLIGVELEPGGWVAVGDLLEACARHGFPISREELDAAVAEPTKRRYAYDDAGKRIRAVQGHSAPVEMDYVPSAPPEELFHGTHPGALEAILRDGLRPMRRQYVHLSADVRAAGTVGARRGRPVILRVAAGELHRAGKRFFRAENGVWLTDFVPSSHLTRHAVGR